MVSILSMDDILEYRYSRGADLASVSLRHACFSEARRWIDRNFNHLDSEGLLLHRQPVPDRPDVHGIAAGLASQPAITLLIAYYTVTTG